MAVDFYFEFFGLLAVAVFEMVKQLRLDHLGGTLRSSQQIYVLRGPQTSNIVKDCLTPNEGDIRGINACERLHVGERNETASLQLFRGGLVLKIYVSTG